MTNQLLTLEYVCTGNNGRSPMAEAIAKDYVHRQGLADRVKFWSSGSGLHQSTKKHGESEITQKHGVVKLALQNGIYQEAWRQEQARLVIGGGPNFNLLGELFDYAVRVEGILRDQALFEKGLVAAGEYHKPTTAWRTIEPWNEYLILPMANSNVIQVRQIYEGSRFKPKIALLNEYAGMEGDVPNPFCQLLPAYREARDHLMVAVPRTVDRAARELLG